MLVMQVEVKKKLFRPKVICPEPLKLSEFVLAAQEYVAFQESLKVLFNPEKVF